MRIFRIFLFTITLSSTISYAQTNKPAKDYLGVPGPVLFDGKLYNLAWSSHPANNYYKHEYVLKGDNVEKFKSMVMLEVLTGDAGPKEIAAAKLEELKKMKETNPMVNYESFTNQSTGDYMIDFLLSASDAKGEMTAVERNIYRYTTISTKVGKKALLLFAVSTRSYGNEITPFLTSLKSTKSQLVNKVAAFKIPETKSL